jgi:hypothetical protein
MACSVYYLAGMGGRLDTGLGQGLLSRGCKISGRVLDGEFRKLDFQKQMPAYVGRVILLSPIVGEFSNEETQMNFIPPRANKLLELAKAGNFPVPKQCEIHVGSEDWQSNPANVNALGALLSIKVSIVPNAGHMLPKEYVDGLLDRWIVRGGIYERAEKQDQTL